MKSLLASEVIQYVESSSDLLDVLREQHEAYGEYEYELGTIEAEKLIDLFVIKKAEQKANSDLGWEHQAARDAGAYTGRDGDW